MQVWPVTAVLAAGIHGWDCSVHDEPAPPATPALDRLDDHLARVEQASQAVELRLVRNERNRLSLLTVHAAMALLIAPLMAISPRSVLFGASFAELAKVPGWPWIASVVLGIGGAILLPATIVRAVRWEMAGLGMIAAWYFSVSVGLASALLHGAKGGLWPPLVYAHLGVIMVVHLRTLRRLYGSR